jgi:cholesterol oxidase
MNYDIIIIGSGFGGAITACRLAEAGKKVLVLERGRRWDKNSYPSVTKKDYLWSHKEPELFNGWTDLRVFKNMSVIQGAGVGGGSLIYANISAEAPAHIFKSPWCEEITYEELKPYYDKVATFMNVQKVPEGQWPERTRLMQEAANKIGEGKRFEPLELAVSFDKELKFAPNAPPEISTPKTFTNKQGREQGFCQHLGLCDAGCPVDAKNTLDLTYIAQAEKHHAEVRPLHIVKYIEPVDQGYRVHFHRIEKGQLIPGSETAKKVIIAAGSLGSTELLFRCRDEFQSLPNISNFLGKHWSSNGDFLTPAYYWKRDIFPTSGPTITSAINFLDQSQGHTFWIEDGGIPDLMGYHHERLRAKFGKFAPGDSVVNVINHALHYRTAFDKIMPWFAQGVDAGDGEFELSRKWWQFGSGEKQLNLKWKVKKSKPMFETIRNLHHKLSKSTGGFPIDSPLWTFSKDLITPHPLGGCGMGNSAATGVVNHRGEVFGYPNLYVVDGAIIPTALGVNPSRTIGALAERIAKLVMSNE